MNARPLDLRRLQVLPLQQRRSLTCVEDILVEPDTKPTTVSPAVAQSLQACVEAIRMARGADAAVILMYGAHLLRNGAALLLDEMMRAGWITHVATNGAGTIHDWEYAWLGKSTESVEENVATGTFGTWEQTGRNLHLALLAGSLRGEGYGTALGRFISEDGTVIPDPAELVSRLRAQPEAPEAPEWAGALRFVREHNAPPGPLKVVHRWKHASILASAFKHGVTATVHPGIGYDIISCHPMFNGALLGRAAELDFKLIAGAVDQLDGGTVLSVGSAIMAPQVFEKSLSCVHNLRFQDGRPPVRGHNIFVVDLQDGGNWDWTQGEPPKDNPAYYLRFCKSFSRMGGTMRYVQCDNVTFIHHLWHALRS